MLIVTFHSFFFIVFVIRSSIRSLMPSASESEEHKQNKHTTQNTNQIFQNKLNVAFICSKRFLFEQSNFLHHVQYSVVQYIIFVLFVHIQHLKFEMYDAQSNFKNTPIKKKNNNFN